MSACVRAHTHTHTYKHTHTHTHTHLYSDACFLWYSEVWGPSEPQDHVSSSPASTPIFCMIEGKSFISLKLGTVHC